jgi:hypothetical protein
MKKRLSGSTVPPIVLARYEETVLERRLREGDATAGRVNALKGGESPKRASGFFSVKTPSRSNGLSRG